MKSILRFSVLSATLVLSSNASFADTLVFPNGSTSTGTVIQTNGDDILFLGNSAAYSFSIAHLGEIKIDPPAPSASDTNILADFRHTLTRLSKEAWAANITPIPATVIDKGVLRNVPYSSFHCANDAYEINVYGDPDHPAGVEIGIYGKLLDDPAEEDRCVEFISALLGRQTDKDAVRSLDHKIDRQVKDGLTFEVTPVTADDSYNGWWVSVYSEEALNHARASDAEMTHISVPKRAVEQAVASDESQWSPAELKNARVTVPQTITFTNRDGELVSNAHYRVYEDGVSLIWHTEKGSAGLVKLADLPEGLRRRFGYDHVKSAKDSAAEKERRAHNQAIYAEAIQKEQMQAGLDAAESLTSEAADDGQSYGGGGGSVYVHGYTRSNGTYVNAYTRSR